MMILSQETAVQKGKPVLVKFFGKYVVRGTVENFDKTKAMIAFGQGTWTVTAPLGWIRQLEDDLLIDIG
jgi:hypothetical protein